MYTCQTFTAPVAGYQTLLGLPFTPNKLRFTVNKTNADKYLSTGEATSSTAQETNTTYFDVIPAGETLTDTTKCLRHYVRQSGVLVCVLSFRFVSFGVNRFKIQVDVPNPSIQIFVEATA